MSRLQHPAEHRMSATEWDDVERVLFVRLDNIGDVILLGPAIRALKSRAPQASITLLASPAGSAIAPLIEGIDDVLTYRAEWQSVNGTVPLLPGRTASLRRTIAEKNFDAAVIFTSFSQSPYPAAMVCYEAEVPRRIAQSKEFGGDVLTHWVTPLGDGLHQADRNLHLLETAGVPPLDTRLTLDVPDAARATLGALLGMKGIDASDPLFVAVPGSSCAARRYDPERLAHALELLAREGDAQVVVAGSEKERWMAELATERCPDIVSVAGLTSVPEFAALIERADAVIASNSSALHIADALERPVLALYSGAEELEQWRPRHTRSVVLTRHAECSPCHQFTCPTDMHCLDVPPIEVADAARALLELPAPSSARPDLAEQFAGQVV